MLELNSLLLVNLPLFWSKISRILLPEAQEVILKLYDVLGREVSTLKEGVVGDGRHIVVVDLHDRPAGVYFFKLITRHGQQVRTLLHVE